MKIPADNTFKAFNLHNNIQTNIHAAGYKAPTPIQQESIPVILAGNDVMGLAQTGTGKTAAFVLPILQRLAPGARGRVRALILAPTRELAQQTHDAIHILGKGLNLRSVPLYGGVSIQPQIHKLRQADIVVACPGRLLDHHTRRTVNLSQVEMLVLDEADHMFDIGFLPNVRKILQLLPKAHQALLFSATMPKEVRQLAQEVLKNPVTIKIGDSAPTKSVTQAIFPVSPGLKNELLLKILQTISAYSVLVFTRTKQRAEQLAEYLNEWGYSATSLQGNLSQSKRQRALNDFRSGKLQILVATDIASRGIDVAHISHVINYDFPSTIEAYTHRIGRTGRASKLGDAFTLVTKAEFGKVRALERALGQAIEQRSISDFDYKAQGLTAMDSDHRHRAPKKKIHDTSTSPSKKKKIFRERDAFKGRTEKHGGERRQRSNEDSRDSRKNKDFRKKEFKGAANARANPRRKFRTTEKYGSDVDFAKERTFGDAQGLRKHKKTRSAESKGSVKKSADSRRKFRPKSEYATTDKPRKKFFGAKTAQKKPQFAKKKHRKKY